MKHNIDIEVKDSYVKEILHASKAVECYGYRKGRPDPSTWIERLEYTPDSYISAIHERFAKETGQAFADNHTCYKVIFRNQVLYIRFDDFHVIVGFKFDPTHDP